MANLSLRHIYKIYSGNVKAVSDFNLEIDDKEFVVFVGPSGCGKSTTLRMIAGLEEISAGELYIDDRLVNDVEPKDRDIAMVFQNYALYPHMTVYDNMAFGLKLRKMPTAEIDQRVKEAAEILSISQLLTRKPKALSGGQRQRVALGRAIVREPKVFLLDEPLSNLDAKLRVQMRTEITKLHNRLATTFIYVTHDQTEAMTMGTRIVVMKDGLMQQVDTPQNLYDSPCNQFVAGFIGTPQMNFIPAKLSKEGDCLAVTFGENKVVLSKEKSLRLVDESFIGKDVIFGVRPEDLHDEEVFIKSSPNTVIKAKVDVLEKLGNETILYTKVDGKEEYCIARVDARTKVKADETIELAIDANHIHLFDPETELTLLGLPQYNFLKAKLSAEGDRLQVAYGNTTLTLPEDSRSKLTKTALIGKEILVGLSPLGVEVDDNGDASDKANVVFVEDNGAYKVVYCDYAKKSGLFAFKAAVNSPIKAKDQVSLKIDPETIQLFDIENKERLLSYGEVPELNKFDTAVTVSTNATTNESTAAVSFGGSSLKLPRPLKKQPEGNAVLTVRPDAIVYTKEEMVGKFVFKVMVEAYDKIGRNTYVFGKLANGAKIVAKVDGKFACQEGKNVKFAVDASQIDLCNDKGDSLL